MNAVLANLGFILQTAGIFTLPAAVVAILYNEHAALEAFLLTSVVFHGIGYLLNALCERRELDFKSSSILLAVTFLSLGVIGSIPYLYTDVFSGYDIASRIVNSLFESFSGYTTTGLTLIRDPDSLPRSIVFYRGLTQWVGGFNMIFIFLAFFYPEKVLGRISRAIGLEKIASTLKKSFVEASFIYIAYTLIFAGIFYLLGLRDLVVNISMVFSTIATGGFSPVTDFQKLIPYPVNFVQNILMIIGATNFAVHHELFTGKFRKVFTAEFLAMILMIFSYTAAMSVLIGADFSTAFFHVVSASTTTGYSFIDLKSLPVSAKALLIFIMFVGGCTFSTAGGIKVKRLLIFLKSVPWVVKGVVTGELDKFVFEGKELKHVDVLSHLLMIMLSAFMIFAFALVFALHGFSLLDSVFELTSAFATTGFSVGITDISLPIDLKIILILVMFMGRVEMIPFLVALSPIVKRRILTLLVPKEWRKAARRIPRSLRRSTSAYTYAGKSRRKRKSR